MFKGIIKGILKNDKIRFFLTKIYNDCMSDLAKKRPIICSKTSIGEILEIACLKSEFNETRINLLVPALSKEQIFGGISTALSFFKEISKSFNNARIILTDQTFFLHKQNPDYLNWEIVESDSDCRGLTIVAMGDRYGKTLKVGKNDFFIATAWWTAYNANIISKWQANQYLLETKKPYIYLIQDYEPGFYPWSSRYSISESTYHCSEDYIAVFNSKLLKDFFNNEGYSFKNSFFFDPILNERLKLLRKGSIKPNRNKRVLFYGRPGVDRNCFEIIVMALKILVQKYNCSEWSFVTAGEFHEDIELGNNIYLKSLGKLTLDEYANELGSSMIGVSLMVSPHPSYPPLEMASFGMKVITNNYKNKNLSLLSSNIYSLSSLSPTSLSDEIIKLMSSNDFNDCTKNIGNYLENYIKDKCNFDILIKQILKILNIV